MIFIKEGIFVYIAKGFRLHDTNFQHKDIWKLHSRNKTRTQLTLENMGSGEKRVLDQEAFGIALLDQLIAIMPEEEVARHNVIG